MEISEQVYKGQTPYKKYLGQMPTVKVVSGREREKKPPRVLTPRRAALASAREMCSLRARRRPEQTTHACCIALDITQSNLRYLKNILKGTQHSGHIKIVKPAPAAKQSVIRLSSLTSASRKQTSWKMMLLFRIKRRGGAD